MCGPSDVPVVTPPPERAKVLVPPSAAEHAHARYCGGGVNFGNANVNVVGALVCAICISQSVVLTRRHENAVVVGVIVVVAVNAASAPVLAVVDRIA